MSDGIDHRAFLEELKGLDADTRRKRRLEFVAWTRAAAGSLGAGAWISPALLLIGIEGILLSFLLPEPRALVAVSILLTALGQWRAWADGRRAREWRRLHPFADWRTGGTPVSV